jgi:hypothetical protein
MISLCYLCVCSSVNDPSYILNPLSLLRNGSVNTVPRLRIDVGLIVSYVVCVVSKESR